MCVCCAELDPTVFLQVLFSYSVCLSQEWLYGGTTDAANEAADVSSDWTHKDVEPRGIRITG